ncbi:odorant receptor 49b-like [Euwallacea fornicatus]|uniref:odorant receptor 49b-like n=1 Tax=Euwallacea fornicatus TaxID=995702 RepID=UPI00338FA87A
MPLHCQTHGKIDKLLFYKKKSRKSLVVGKTSLKIIRCSVSCKMILPNNKLLQIPMYSASTVGIWPIISIKNQRMKKIYNIYSSILYYYYLEYIFRAYCQLFLLLTAVHLNVEEILGNLCITLIYTVSLFRLKAFDTHEIKTLFSNIIKSEDFILHDSDPTVRQIYLSGVKINRIYHIMFFFNGWFVSLLYFLHPFFMDLSTVEINNTTITLKTLPLSTWWPIDVQKNYWLAYCWNVCDGTLGSSFVINSDMLTFSLVVFAVTQLDILSYRLSQFKLIESGNKETFIGLIRQHQDIIAYVDTFNDGMKYVMLFDFLQSSVQFATTMLQLFVMTVNFQNVFFVGQFLMTMVMRVAIYYFNGNKIIYKSQRLATDLWNTDWYLHNEETKKLEFIFLLRAQKPLKFLIGPFGVMSLETFISILKATYSYMMLFINRGSRK